MLLSIVCYLKKKNAGYNIKSEIFSVFCVSKFVFLKCNINSEILLSIFCDEKK